MTTRCIMPTKLLKTKWYIINLENKTVATDHTYDRFMATGYIGVVLATRYSRVRYSGRRPKRSNTYMFKLSNRIEKLN